MNVLEQLVLSLSEHLILPRLDDAAKPDVLADVLHKFSFSVNHVGKTSPY
jgi:hypothetical protein